MGIGTFAVTLAANYAFQPTVNTIVLPNVVLWVVANACLLALYIPKLMEAVSELQEQQDLGMSNLPSASLFSETQTKYSIKLVTAATTLHMEESHKGDTVEHINL
ncbi:hypothetical protein HDU76_005699, partial [Blyttiomyces sp. JEL0837]